jgi:DeoR family glycerol-3-phosphate regulon repressor
MYDYRTQTILSRLLKEHRVNVYDLSRDLGVSDETIRRDLKELEAKGIIRRVHGGAVPASRVADEPLTNRIQQRAKEKAVIASLARELIHDDSVIFLDTGTTTLALARHFGDFKKIKLYTNSLLIAQAACEHLGVTVLMTPGHLRPIEQDLVGYDTIAYLQQFYFDIAFMGVAAVNVDYGFMDFEDEEARIRQALFKQARRSVFLADTSKFGKTANVITAPFSTANTLVTERRPDSDFLKVAKRAKLEIVHG